MRTRNLPSVAAVPAALLLLAFASFSCGGSSGVDCDTIDNPCTTDGALRCSSSNDAIESCLLDADACLAWTSTTTCGEHQTCQTADDASTCTCDLDCTVIDDTQCQGEIIQTCTSDDDDCLFWQDGQDCAADEKVCDDLAEPAICKEDCNNNCEEGASQCSGSTIQICTLLDDNCTYWVDDANCTDSDQICSDTSGTASCYEPCTHECTEADAVLCDGNKYRACVVGDDGCNDWGATVDCSDNGQICSDASGVGGCYDPCGDSCFVVAATRCHLDLVQTCALGADGCWAWILTTDCTVDSLSCYDINDGPGCYTTCANECETLDATQCNDTATDIQICRVGGDGCNDWTALTNCPSSGQDCWDSRCVEPCTHECEPVDSTQCDVTEIITQDCVLNNDDGCNDWVDNITCEEPSPKCEMVDDTATCICVNECDPLGWSCNGETPENCVMGDDGCHNLEISATCAEPSPKCEMVSDVATCVCVDECPTVGAQCNGTVPETCELGADGCNDFIVGTSCAPKACIDSGSTAECQSGCTTIRYQPTTPDVGSFLAQDFETAYDQHDVFAADDFTLSGTTSITTIWTGSYVNGGTYANASKINFAIYGNSGGEPSGVPVHGAAPLKLVSLSPSDSQLFIAGQDVVVNLNTPISLGAGTYWFAMWVTMDSNNLTRWNVWKKSDTTNGYDLMGWSQTSGGWISMVANPGDKKDLAFGLLTCP